MTRADISRLPRSFVDAIALAGFRYWKTRGTQAGPGNYRKLEEMCHWAVQWDALSDDERKAVEPGETEKDIAA